MNPAGGGGLCVFQRHSVWPKEKLITADTTEIEVLVISVGLLVFVLRHTNNENLIIFIQDQYGNPKSGQGFSRPWLASGFLRRGGGGVTLRGNN